GESMKTINSTGVGLVTSALTLVAWPAGSVLARGVAGPQASGSSSGAPQSGWVTTAVVVASLLAVLVVLGALIKMLDLKRKRETEAVVVQARISDAVLRDPRLFSLPITPTAHVPLWKGTPVTVEVAGQVPSDGLREPPAPLIHRPPPHLRPDARAASPIS